MCANESFSGLKDIRKKFVHALFVKDWVKRALENGGKLNSQAMKSLCKKEACFIM